MSPSEKPLRRPEPVAVIGLACRFPGASTPDAYWRLLQGDASAIGPAPASRWRWDARRDEYPPQVHEARLGRGGFIDGLEDFDAGFFGLPPAEAERLDPQHRLAMELSWEALEAACVRPRDLAGSFTGVVMGVAHSDHAVKVLNDHGAYDGKEGLHAYECFTANRVSNALNLKGPSYAVNAACASSLHALHVACQTLRSGECDLVLAGGVNACVSPDEIVSSAMAGWLAEDGEGRSFAAGGTGFVTGEGCAVLVLKRLDDAVRDGDRVWGVIRDTALGHNGLASSISWPSGNAQRDLLRRLLARNGLAGADIDALEAHGSGGPMSDRIEASAAADVLGAGRDEATGPLRVGCCKAHVGHLQGASGLAGVVKMILALQRETLPALRGFDKPHDTIKPHPGLRFLAAAEAWPRGARARRAIVSNFSFGGANGMLLLEEAPAGLGPFDDVRDDAADADPRGLRLLALRASSDAGLDALRTRLAAHLDGRGGRALDDDELHTLDTYRAELRHRLLVAGRGLAGLDASLRDPARGALARTRERPPAWRDAPPVLALHLGAAFGSSDEQLALLRAGRIGRRLWTDFARESGLADDASLGERGAAAFWLRTLARLGVPLRAVMADDDLSPAVALAWRATDDAAALRRWIATGEAPDAGASADDPDVVAPVGAEALPTWSLSTGRASLVVAPVPAAAIPRGDAPQLALDVARDAPDADDAIAALLGGLFVLGSDLRWTHLTDGVKRPVPAAPFDRRRAWFDPAARDAAASAASSAAEAAAVVASAARSSLQTRSP